MEGATKTGSLSVNWEGLKLVRDENRGVGRAIRGVKGVGEGVVRFESGTGSVVLSG